MKIARRTYQILLNGVVKPPPESGGILGGRCNIITHSYIDVGKCARTIPMQYQPNTSVLNQIILLWEKQDVEFYGIFHSHHENDMQLSTRDENYIHTIMRELFPTKKRLYFPIVFPRKNIIAYCAETRYNTVHIFQESIKIL